jgi:hypothetical protein
MSAIQLDLTQLPPTARRQSIEVLHRPELIATFIRRHQWTDNPVSKDRSRELLMRHGDECTPEQITSQQSRTRRAQPRPAPE